MSAPELIGELVARAEDDALFARHAAAYDELRNGDPDLLSQIEREDHLFEKADLAAPADDA